MGKITDLQLRDEIAPELNFPVDDTLQSYRVTMAQLSEYIESYLESKLWRTGDAKISYRATADAGWIKVDDGTIGAGGSGATTRANDDIEDLYILMWTNFSNTIVPVTGGRGATASADFVAGKVMTIPKILGRALAAGGAGSGLTSRAVGSIVGAETHSLTANENGVHTHLQNSHSHTINGRSNAGGTTNTVSMYSNGATAASTSTASATATNQNSGLGDAHNNMQPTSFFNVYIKL